MRNLRCEVVGAAGGAWVALGFGVVGGSHSGAATAGAAASRAAVAVGRDVGSTACGAEDGAAEAVVGSAGVEGGGGSGMSVGVVAVAARCRDATS